MQKTFILSLILLFSFYSCSRQPAAVVDGTRLPDHPRLLYTVEDASRVRKLLKNDLTVQKLQTAIIARADELLETPDMDLSDVSSLGKSREYVNRLFTLGIAYRQTGDMKYVARVEESLALLCACPDWYPAHYLNVAEMTTAVAVVYDWMYDVLKPETKASVVEAIHRNAIENVLKEYETGDSESWAKRETNWNVVCNTGMVLGALAVAEHYPEEAAVIVKNAARYMPNCLKHFAPDGVCYEGPAYYEYTNIYLSMCLKALDDNFADCFGLDALEGISKTAGYYVHTVSPSGLVFNFADVGREARSSASPLFFYFSRKFGLSEVADYYRNKLNEVLESNHLPSWHFPLALAWYDDTPYDGSANEARMETFHNINDILVLRGDRRKEGSVHLMAKGGDPDMAHQQADGGSFVFESDGIRWLVDLGCDGYSIPGFWGYHGPRWYYFRESSLSHNTLSIDGKCQYWGGTARFCEENPDNEKPSATYDMTTLYPVAKSVKRTFTLEDDFTISVTDLVEAKGKHILCWTAATDAEVRLKDGGVILEKNGKSVYINPISPAGALFTTEEAKPWTEYEKPLDGVTLIHCLVPVIGKGEISIVLKSKK